MLLRKVWDVWSSLGDRKQRTEKWCVCVFNTYIYVCMWYPENSLESHLSRMLFTLFLCVGDGMCSVENSHAYVCMYMRGLGRVSGAFHGHSRP